MAFPTILNSNVNTSTGTSHNVTLGATATAGNLLLLVFVPRNFVWPAAPTGWQPMVYEGQTAYAPNTFIKVSDGTETGVIFTTASTNAAWAIFEIADWSGAFPSALVEAQPVDKGGVLVTDAGATSSSPNPPANNPAAYEWADTQTLWITLFYITNGSRTVSAIPSGYTDLGYQGVGTTSGIAIGAAYRQLNASSEDPGPWTISASTGWSAVTFSIRSADSLTPNARVTQLASEVSYSGEPGLRVTTLSSEVTYGAFPALEISQYVLEVAYIPASGTSYYYTMQEANDMAIPLRHATAAQTKTVSPLISSANFVDPMTALTIANTDIKLMKNGATAVDKNSGGATALVNGEYSITLDATDTDTVGELKVSVFVSGALVACKTFIVVEEVVFDALYAPGAPGFLGAGAGTTISDIDTNVDAVIAMLVDIQGPTFNDTLHNLENIYNTLDGLRQALVPASAVPDSSTLVTGISVSGTTADMVTANDTRRVVTPTTGGLSLTIDYQLGTDRLPTGLDIQGYYTAAGSETIKVDAYNFVTAAYDRISVPGATEIPNGASDVDYQYYLSRQHVDAAGLVRIKLSTTTETDTYELHVDRAIVYHVDAVAIGAGLTAAEVWNYHRRRLTDGSGNTVPVEDIIRSGDSRTIARSGKPSISFTETRD